MVAVRRGCSHRQAICNVSGGCMKARAYQIWEKTQSSQISDTGLSGLGLLFSTNDRDEGDVNQGKVLVTDSELELAHGLDEWRGFDITDGTAELNLSFCHYQRRQSSPRQCRHPVALQSHRQGSSRLAQSSPGSRWSSGGRSERFYQGSLLFATSLAISPHVLHDSPPGR